MFLKTIRLDLLLHSNSTFCDIYYCLTSNVKTILGLQVVFEIGTLDYINNMSDQIFTPSTFTLTQLKDWSGCTLIDCDMICHLIECNCVSKIELFNEINAKVPKRVSLIEYVLTLESWCILVSGWGVLCIRTFLIAKESLQGVRNLNNRFLKEGYCQFSQFFFSKVYIWQWHLGPHQVLQPTWKAPGHFFVIMASHWRLQNLI